MAKIPINISLVANSTRNNVSSSIGINLSNTGTKGYFNLLDSQNNTAFGVSAATNSDWSRAWKEQQLMLEKRNSPRLDHSDPTPLLVDIISSLPPNSSRRRNYENLKFTIEGISPNVGYGLDTMTRESYRDLKRLSKQSQMIYDGMRQPLPEANNLLGTEEGQYVSNLQDWRPAFANAGKPISDAMGSHSDTDHSIIKDAAGAPAFLPSSCVGLLDKVTPQLTDVTEGSFKGVQLEMLQHLPSKIAGNLRHLSTALDSVLSIPFEIASDVYNGLRQLMSQISDLIDGLVSNIVGWVISSIGGLIDGLFPEGLLNGVMDAVSSIADEFGDLFDLLGGFSIVSDIRDILSNILSGNFLAAIGDIFKLGQMLTSGIGSGSFLGGLAGAAIDCIDSQLNSGKASSLFNKINKAVSTGKVIGGILGSLPAIGQGLGNLGSIIGNGVSTLAGSAISAIRNLPGIIAGLLPAGIGYILNKLIGKLCNVGLAGNKGYSVGNTFDNFRNRTFDRCMNTHSTHASILGPLFNKQTDRRGSYAMESDLPLFDDSRFVVGAQSTKGVTMVGPGGSVAFKPFGLFQGGYNYVTTSSSPVSPLSPNRSYISPGNGSLGQQLASLNLSIRGLPLLGMQTNTNFGIVLPSF